jgi:uncharacterized protein
MDKKHNEIKKIVENELACAAHDMKHVMRVYNLSLKIAESMSNVDMDVLKTAVLLHDIARVKEDEDNSGNVDHAVLGASMAEEILTDMNYTKNKIESVKDCILSHRFRTDREPQSIEAKILFDADKLDIIGAIGLARSFMIAGEYAQEIYSTVELDDYISTNLVGGDINGRIKDISKHTPNLEFQIKLVRIPEKLYTKSAREIGERRVNFMKGYYNRLQKEFEGLM